LSKADAGMIKLTHPFVVVTSSKQTPNIPGLLCTWS